MLRINLLPIKAAKKHDTAKQELIGAAGLLLLTAGGLYMWNSSISTDISEAGARITRVNAEIKQLKELVVQVEGFKKKAAALERKISAIQKLQTQRLGPAKLLNDLATILTEERKVWLTSIVEKGGKMTLKGYAMEEENISDFQLALERRSRHFSDVRLSLMNRGSVDGVPVLNWTMTCTAVYRPG